MNTPQTRLITLSAMKATNTEHTAINGNHSKCRMTFFLRIAVQWLTIAVHKEMIFRNVNPLFQTANVGFYATAIISFVHLAKVDYVLACS